MSINIPKEIDQIDAYFKENFNKNMINLFIDDLKDVLFELNKSTNKA